MRLIKWASLSLIVLGFCIALGLGPGASSAPPGANGRKVVPIPAQSPVAGDTSTFESAALTASGTLRKLRESSGPRSSSATGGPAETAWPGQYQRSNFNLLEYFISAMGSLDASRFVRHVQLNPADAPLSKEQVDDLARIVGSINEIMLPVAEHFAESKQKEMVMTIERGLVQAEENSSPSRGVLQAMASHDIAEGKYPGMTLEQVISELEHRNMLSVPATGIVYKGKVYLEANFGSLPLTERSLRTMKVLALDNLASVASWFGACGCGTSEGLVAAFQDADALTREELARRGPAFEHR